MVVVDDAQRPVGESARLLQQRLWEALQHASVSGVIALRQLRRREPGRASAALPVVFTSLIGVGPGGRQDGGFGRDVTFAVCRTSDVSLEHQVWERGGGLCYRWDVTPERFPAGALETTFAAFENSLRTFCLEPGPLAHRPLNDLQQAYYVARVSGPQAPWNGCQIYESFEVDDFDLLKLERALLRLVEGYEALRTGVSPDGRLEIRSKVPGRWSIPVIDLNGVEEPAASLASIRDEMAGHAFSPGTWPPFDLRVTRLGGRATVHCSFDLAVFDARSIHLLCRELFRLYDDPEATPRAPLPADGRLRARAVPETERRSRESYWEGRLEHLPPGPALHAGDSPVVEPRRIRLQGRLSSWSELARLAEQQHVEPDMLLLDAFLEVLSGRLGGRPFAVPFVRFPASEEPYRPGEFTALSWVERTAGGSLAERATAYQRIIDGDLSAGSVSGLSALRRRVMRERGKGDFAFPVVYTTVVDLTGSPLPSGVRQGGWLSCTPDVSLDCIGIREGEDLFFCWDAAEQEFIPGQLAAMFGEYQLLLERLVRGDLEGRAERAAAQTERERILYAWNDTTTGFPTERLLHQLFEERAAECPDAVALRGRGWGRSYAELNRDANRIAWHLKALGVGPETVVAVSIRRGPLMVAACLGVLKAGGAYLPVEPSLPQERAALLLDETRATVLLTTSTSLDWQAPPGTRVVYVDGELEAPDGRDGAAVSNPAPAGYPDNTAYIIFTSGSTGRPKGVAVAHRAVLNLLHWCGRTFDFGADDLGLCVTSLGFDLSVFDIFGLLGVGGAIYVADETELKDPHLLLEIMLRERITFWNSAPTSLGQLAPLLPTVHGAAETDALRLVFLSGDYTPLSLPDNIRAAFPRARVVSLGGATEATVWSNFFPVEQIDPAWRSIPYGRPIDNARYHVLDPELEPCPVGVEGDLYIGGECLSRGYYRQPGLTAERFIPDSFAREPGEGVGAVLLKPLHAALADGDRIHAVIKGAAVNHGGRTSGYMVPNPLAQAEMIRDALHTAGIPAASISYVEAHGTGTELGDPIEINGLERAFAGERPSSGYWPVGSVKSSIGHLEGAAGIASLTKVVLQLRYKLLAPSLHAERLNPNVDWERSPFQVQRQLAEWHAPRDERGRPTLRRAAISSFGAGVANAHVVVEEYAGAEAGPGEDDMAPSRQLVVLSARDEERLRAAAGALAAFLGQQPLPLPDIAYTLQVGREHLRERLAVTVADLAELRERLNRFRLGDEAGMIRGRSPAGAPTDTSAADAPSVAGARVAGLIRMLGSEHTRVAATTMDADVSEAEALDAARQIAAELSLGRRPEICYRRGRRYRPELSAVAMPDGMLRLDPEQVYVFLIIQRSICWPMFP